MPFTNILLVFTLIIWAAPAHAYLDPSSGSALTTALIAALSGLIYKLKSIYYYFFGEKDPLSKLASESDIIIFSEGKNYWGTFRPITEELINRKIHFRYITLDLYDPALEIETPYMHARLIGKKQSGFTFFANIQAKLMLSTTPNIGNQNSHLKRPKGVDNLVHVFHSVSDISIYQKHSLDHYDSVILSGDFQSQSIREIEQKRGLKEKKLSTLGMPYLDALNQQLTQTHLSRENSLQVTDLQQTQPRVPTPQIPRPEINKNPTILIGSSWGQKGCLQVYGIEFIKALSTAGYSVIIRPHPQSYISELDFITRCEQEMATFDNVSWDKDTSPFSAMQSSDLLISDTSSIRFDYAFLFKKPVITLDIERENLTAFEANDLEEIWTDWASERIGKVINKNDIADLPSIVKTVLADLTSNNIEAMREEMVVNWGESSKYIVDYIIKETAA